MPSSPVPVVIIRPPGRRPYAIALDRLTAQVRAARVLRMGKLAAILAKASDARAGLETALENDVAGYIDRVNGAHKRREGVFLKKHAELDADVSDLAEFEKDLSEFDGKNDHSGAGNNGDAYAATRPPKSSE